MQNMMGCEICEIQSSCLTYLIILFFIFYILFFKTTTKPWSQNLVLVMDPQQIKFGQPKIFFKSNHFHQITKYNRNNGIIFNFNRLGLFSIIKRWPWNLSPDRVEKTQIGINSSFQYPYFQLSLLFLLTKLPPKKREDFDITFPNSYTINP